MRYIAFLRAVNVGGRVVRMDALRRLFESLGHANVETFIASGNVVFDSPSRSGRALEHAIATRLKAGLGYEVDTFVRTCEEVAAVATHAAFEPEAIERAASFIVAFVADPLDPPSRRKLMALRSDLDEFHVHGREVYWLCHVKQSESAFSNAVFEKTVGRRTTMRGIGTLRKMAAKYPGLPGLESIR